MGTVQHQARNIVDGYSLRQILRPFLIRQPPVLVRHQLTGTQKILKRIAVHRQNPDSAVRSKSQCLTAFVFNQEIAVLFRFGPFLTHLLLTLLYSVIF